jgi:phytoene synthase
MADDFAYCEELIRGEDRDRYLATLFAPPAARPALFALYALDLELFRVASIVRQPLAGEIRLQWWREVVSGDRCEEVAASPIASAFRKTMTRCGFDRKALLDMIDAHAIEFDPEQAVIPDIATLDDCGTRTAGRILELAGIVLLGDESASHRTLFALGGIASYICRVLVRLPQHARHGHVYVPAEIIRAHGASVHDLLVGTMTQEARAAIGATRRHAEATLAQLRDHLAQLPDALGPALLPLALVGPTLRRLARSGDDPYRPRPLSSWRQQWTLWRASRDLPRFI